MSQRSGDCRGRLAHKAVGVKRKSTVAVPDGVTPITKGIGSTPAVPPNSKISGDEGVTVYRVFAMLDGLRRNSQFRYIGLEFFNKPNSKTMFFLEFSRVFLPVTLGYG